jgi:regulatory protein
MLLKSPSASMTRSQSPIPNVDALDPHNSRSLKTISASHAANYGGTRYESMTTGTLFASSDSTRDISGLWSTIHPVSETPAKCLQHAMRFLKRKLLSEHELAGKLLARDYAEAEVARTLDRLRAMGYLNDKRLAEDRALIGVNRKVGRHKVTRKLNAAGIDQTLAHDAVEDAYSTTDEARTAREILLAKKPQFDRVDRPTAHRRAFGLLMRRGFGEDETRLAINEVLGELHDASD